jgi:hypothetical protein
MTALSDLDRQILAFEQRRWLHQGVKDEAITTELGLTPIRYAQLLNALIDKPEALAAEPVLVKRLRRLRDTRRQARRAG